MSTQTPSQEQPVSSARLRTWAVVALVLSMLAAPGLVVLVGHAASADAGSSPSGLSALSDKPISFIESGLPAGTVWSVALDGTLQSSASDEITFSESPGTYSYTVTPVPGYVAAPSSGTVTLNDCMATVDVTFTPTVTVSSYNVWFNETGLPTGTAWWVDFNDTNVTSTSSSILFAAPNGTYVFVDPAVVAGPAGTQYVTTVNNGTVTVDGTNVSVAVPYSTQFYLTMNVTPAPGGTVFPGSGWYPAGAIVALSESPNATYQFIAWNGTGTGNYTGTEETPSVTMSGPITEIGVFGVSYEVTFEETGLLDGVTWSVTFNGVTESEYFVFLDFSAVNGTYAYSIAPIPGYHTPSYSGSVTVAGADVTVVVPWVRVTYNVSYVESGLPGGTSWSVTLNGSTMSATSSTITYTESNGTYPWSIAPVDGYVANVTGGDVDVNGASVVIDIGWSASNPVPASYSVTFVESGLPAGTSWSVSLNSSSTTSLGSAQSTVVFAGVSDGTYSFWVPTVGSYLPAKATGGFTVAGANVTIDVSFTAHLLPAASPPTKAGITALEVLVFLLVAGGVGSAAYLLRRLRPKKS